MKYIEYSAKDKKTGIEYSKILISCDRIINVKFTDWSIIDPEPTSIFLYEVEIIYEDLTTQEHKYNDRVTANEIYTLIRNKLIKPTNETDEE